MASSRQQQQMASWPQVQLQPSRSSLLQPPLLASSQYPRLAPSHHPRLALSQQPGLAPSQQPGLAPSQQAGLALDQQPGFVLSQQPRQLPPQQPCLVSSQQPRQQPPLGTSQQSRPAPTPRTLQLEHQHDRVSGPSPVTHGRPGSILPHPTPNHSYIPPQTFSPGTSVSETNAGRKRSATDMAVGDVPTAKRQAVASPAANGEVRAQVSPPRAPQPTTQQNPREQNPLLKMAVEMEAKEKRLAASRGESAALDQQKRRERVETIYRFLLAQQRANEDKKRQEQVRLAQIEIRRQKEENDQKEKEAAEQRRIAAIREKDRLDNIRIKQAQEQALQEEQQRKAARAAATAERKRREGMRNAQAELRQHQEACDRYRAEQAHCKKRKAELQNDPNRNFHSYFDTIKYWPLPRGERQNHYMRGLLANQHMPSSADSDLAIAIKYAKEHWYYYRQYPQDVECTVQDAKAVKQKKQ